MEMLKLKCQSNPTHGTQLLPESNGQLIIQAYTNYHTREQAEQLRDWLNEYLAAHAVIDAPAGVPNVEELTLIGGNAYHRALDIPEYKSYSDMGHQAKTYYGAFTSAIRDAVLAAMPQPREWSEEDVDALARAIHESECAAQGDPDIALTRVALQWMAGKRGEI